MGTSGADTLKEIGRGVEPMLWIKNRIGQASALTRSKTRRLANLRIQQSRWTNLVGWNRNSPDEIFSSPLGILPLNLASRNMWARVLFLWVRNRSINCRTQVKAPPTILSSYCKGSCNSRCSRNVKLVSISLFASFVLGSIPLARAFFLQSRRAPDL
jgi:hypothetical protein